MSVSGANKRKRKLSKSVRLRRAIIDVLKDEEELALIAGASVSPDLWDHDDEEEWNAEIERVRTVLNAALSVLADRKTGEKRGRPARPYQPCLTDIQKRLLRVASAYHARTGRCASNGARGRNITNQGGPFVREAATALNMAPEKIIGEIDKLEKHPGLKELWDRERGASPSPSAVFGEAIKRLRTRD